MSETERRTDGRITVFLADDNLIVREGVRALLATDEGLEPVASEGELTSSEQELLRLVTEGRSIKAIASARNTTPADIATCLDDVFLRLASPGGSRAGAALKYLRLLHQAVDREEQGETLARLSRAGLVEKLRSEGRRIGETERFTVTILMSDIRGYTSIAEHADPTDLAGQLNQHRAAMTHVVLGDGGTGMQYVGDAVLAVFGAPFPQPDHADRAVSAARGMHESQAAIAARWQEQGLAGFSLGIGLSTGAVAAALLGSEERLEYSLVGDTVRL